MDFNFSCNTLSFHGSFDVYFSKQAVNFFSALSLSRSPLLFLPFHPALSFLFVDDPKLTENVALHILQNVDKVLYGVVGSTISVWIDNVPG